MVRWQNQKTAKKGFVPTVAAYFRVKAEALIVQTACKVKKFPTKPRLGSLNYHLAGLAKGDANYVEVRCDESVGEAQAQIWSSLSRAPQFMMGMKFETTGNTCVGPTFGDQVRYVIRVERLR